MFSSYQIFGAWFLLIHSTTHWPGKILYPHDIHIIIQMGTTFSAIAARSTGVPCIVQCIYLDAAPPLPSFCRLLRFDWAVYFWRFQVLPEPLLSEKLRLLAEGFADWSKAQYMIFVRASAKNGRGAYDRIAAEVGKAEKDVRVSSCFRGAFGEVGWGGGDFLVVWGGL